MQVFCRLQVGFMLQALWGAHNTCCSNVQCGLKLLLCTGDTGRHYTDDICPPKSWVCASSGRPHPFLIGTGAHAFTQKGTLGGRQKSVPCETIQHAACNRCCVGSWCSSCFGKIATSHKCLLKGRSDSAIKMNPLKPVSSKECYVWLAS